MQDCLLQLQPFCFRGSKVGRIWLLNILHDRCAGRPRRFFHRLCYSTLDGQDLSLDERQGLNHRFGV